MLQGRAIPIQVITDLLAQARQNRSGALLVHGEAGMGKSALLEYAVSQADEMTVLRGVGHQTEARLPFALLDQMMRSLLPMLELLPRPQVRALKAALGLSEETVRDRFLISAAVLSLLAEAAERRPVLCVVDDLQWADQGSVDALVFAARRLEAEGVAIVMAARTDPSRDVRMSGIPHLELEGLDHGDALALLRTHFGEVPRLVADRIIATSGGNPLALIELPRVLDASAMPYATSLPDPLPAGTGIRRVFLEQVHALSTGGQGMLAVAAADPEATCMEVLAVADRLGIDAEALAECEAGRFVSSENQRVVFRHPLIRAAAYYDSSAVSRHRLHAAFADLLSAERDPERQVWHRSLAAEGPDERVAEALEVAAERCRDRGALETAGWGYERAAQLSEVSTRAAWRMLHAAEAAHLAGQPDRAKELIERSGHLNDEEQLRVELDELRGRLELRIGVPSDAHAYLISAARRVSPSDPVRAIQMLTEAGEAASYAGDRDLIVDTGRQAAFLMQGVEGAARLPALVLFGSGKVVSGEAELGRSICREAVALADRVTEPRDLVWASIAAQYAGDEVKQHALAARAAAAARATGQLGMLPYALEFVALSELSAGRFLSARATATEGLSLARELGQENSIGATWPCSAGSTPCRAVTNSAPPTAPRRSACPPRGGSASKRLRRIGLLACLSWPWVGQRTPTRALRVSSPPVRVAITLGSPCWHVPMPWKRRCAVANPKPSDRWLPGSSPLPGPMAPLGLVPWQRAAAACWHRKPTRRRPTSKRPSGCTNDRAGPGTELART